MERQTTAQRSAAPRGDATDATMLLARHLAGDDHAFAELFGQLNHRLYLYCLKLVGSSEQAEDLTMELWEKVIRLRTRDQHVENAPAFLFRIARNLCLNHIKASRRVSPLSLMDERQHPLDRSHERSEREDAVHDALRELPLDYREVLVLHVYCGYQFEEIAAMLEKSPESIWKRASRARKKLRESVMRIMAHR